RRAGLVALFLSLALGACASGPTYSEMQTSIPALAPDLGRIYVYRATVVGAAVQPSVLVNGTVAGNAKPLGFFYVDGPAGDYTISATTEVTRTLTLGLVAGQTRYVRLAMSLGFFVGHVSPELVDDARGAADISTLHYTGGITLSAA